MEEEEQQNQAQGASAGSAASASSGVQDFTQFGAGSISIPVAPTPRRKFAGFSPVLTDAQIKEIQGDPNIQFTTIRTPKRGVGPTYVRGSVLFDEQGRIAGKFYDFTDPFIIAREMYKLNTQERIRVSKEMERIGWYGSQEVSEALIQGLGWTDTDEKVWAQLLDIANKAQKPWTEVVGMLGTFSSAKAGTGTTVRVTSDEDAMAYAREAFFSRLGRAPTKKELADAIDYIQNRERMAVRANQQMPSSQLTASRFAESVDPTAATTWGLGNAVAIAMGALGQ